MSNSHKSSLHTSSSPDNQSKGSTKFYGARESEKTNAGHESKNHKIKVLKPIINYQHNANKILGDMVNLKNNTSIELRRLLLLQASVGDEETEQQGR